MIPEDVSPGPHKLKPIPEGYLVTNVTGIRAHVVSRMDGKGYDVTQRKVPHLLGSLLRLTLYSGAPCRPRRAESSCNGLELC